MIVLMEITLKSSHTDRDYSFAASSCGNLNTFQHDKRHVGSVEQIFSKVRELEFIFVAFYVKLMQTSATYIYLIPHKCSSLHEQYTIISLVSYYTQKY